MTSKIILKKIKLFLTKIAAPIIKMHIFASKLFIANY